MGIRVTYVKKDNEVIWSGNKVGLIPEQTKVTIDFNIDNLSLDNAYIKVSSGSESTYYSVADSQNNSLSITIPKLYSNTREISFQGAYEDNEEIVADESGDPVTLEDMYVYPVEINLTTNRISRYTSDYTTSNPSAPYLRVDALEFQLKAGQLADIQSITITPIKNGVGVASTEAITELSNYISTCFGNGYEETANSGHIFSALNKAGYFADLSATYTFSVDFVYSTIDASCLAATGTIQLSNLTLVQTYDTLSLVGRTQLNNGKYIYGGVAMGQAPTISQIGEAAFECGYPAYFQGIRYGYYAGDTIEIDSNNLIAGFITSSSSEMKFSLFIGQPIYAQSVQVSGNIVIRSDGGYIKNYSWDAPHICDGTEQIAIIDRKCGLINIIISGTTFKNGSSTAGNNKPLTLSGGNGAPLVITFI